MVTFFTKQNPKVQKNRDIFNNEVDFGFCVIKSFGLGRNSGSKSNRKPKTDNIP
jgi:hypothetical protein